MCFLPTFAIVNYGLLKLECTPDGEELPGSDVSFDINCAK